MDALPQVPPPLPPPPTPARFNLPLGAWIAWGVYVALNIALLCIRKDTMDAYKIGELMGGAVAALILPAIIALIVWRVGGRSRSAGNVTFFVVFGMAMLGQLAQFMRKAEANAAMDQLTKEHRQIQEEQRAALKAGRPLDEAKAVKLAEQASAKLAAVAENSSGSDRIVAEAGKAFMDELLAVKKRYDLAVTNLDAKNFWSLAKFSPGTQAEARRAAVRAFVQANIELREIYDEEGTALRRQLEARGASTAVVRNSIAGYKDSAAPRLALLRKIRDDDAQLAQVMLDFIDFVESNRERWHIDASNGKIIFGNQDLLDRYNELIKRSKAISAEQTEYQKQMVAAQSTR